MKKQVQLTLFFVLSFALTGLSETALDYMNAISSKYKTLQQDMWDYTSSVAHGKNARKIDSKRTTLIQTTYRAMNEVKLMSEFEGDGAYRDSVASFLNIYYNVLREDYAKIVDMEEISERSYNDMEAYMNAKAEANEKLNSAATMVSAQQRKFAETHGITLLDATDDLSQKMKVADEVYEYYNVLYLIFFKSYIQEKYLIDAINAKDVSGIEQNKNALITTSNEGLDLLKGISDFKGDNTVVMACKDLLTFYKDESENKTAIITNYFIKTENFNTVKTSFEAIKPNNRTQADVDAYNKAVNEMNESINSYNATNSQLSADRSKYLENWNNSSSKFTDKHVPKGK